MVATVEHELLLRYEIEQFLIEEAAMLDDGRFHEWLQLCTEDIHYTVPVRTSRERNNGDGNSTMMNHFDDDYAGLETRIVRLDTEYAWAEDPPSRTRHFVSNVRFHPASAADEYDVQSNILVYRNRGDSPKHDLVSGERHDRIRRSETGLKLARRRVVLDNAVVATHNLAFFL